MGFNETYGKVQAGMKIIKHISHTEWRKTKKSFTVTVLQRCFRICRLEGTRQPERTGLHGTNQLTVCAVVNWKTENTNTINHNTDNVSDARKDLDQMV